ncbi:hypothetical protein [Thiohalomonas denitrificans]|uniref:Uncharacterized protein n=1 Tax=Thiohalomonas denitrificans TaxID=415747 RepID=A0A1G5PTL1_9GAMM|nr:hypothetical protein [Thiohalomonas denitrificans]SCZ52570.1 hypothetical protein SAMN03097708_00769 [Thiohalomonas denitrificans]
MENTAHFYRQLPVSPTQHQTRMLEEIAYLEARLRDIGITGDCAYEKSLARTYDVLLRERREQLADSGIQLSRPDE